MVVQRPQSPEMILVNFTVEIAISFFTHTTTVTGKKIIIYAGGLERIALR